MKLINHIIGIAILLIAGPVSAKISRTTAQPVSSLPTRAQTQSAPQVAKPVVPVQPQIKPAQQSAPTAKTFTFYVDEVKNKWVRKDVIGDDGRFTQKFINFVSDSNVTPFLQQSLLEAGRSFHLLLSGKNDGDLSKIVQSQGMINDFVNQLQQQPAGQPQPQPKPQQVTPSAQPKPVIPQPQQQPAPKPIAPVNKQDILMYTKDLLEINIKVLTSQDNGIFIGTTQGYRLIDDVDARKEVIVAFSDSIKGAYKDATNQMIADALITGFNYLASMRMLNVSNIKPLIDQIYIVLSVSQPQVQPQPVKQPVPVAAPQSVSTKKKYDINNANESIKVLLEQYQKENFVAENGEIIAGPFIEIAQKLVEEYPELKADKSDVNVALYIMNAMGFYKHILFNQDKRHAIENVIKDNWNEIIGKAEPGN